MTIFLFTDTSDPPFVAALFHHWDYRNAHDVLHSYFQSACSERCPVRDHILLQDKIVAIRAVERRAR